MLLVPSTVFYVLLHGCGVVGVPDFHLKTEEYWSKISFDHGFRSSADSLDEGHVIHRFYECDKYCIGVASLVEQSCWPVYSVGDN